MHVQSDSLGTSICTGIPHSFGMYFFYGYQTIFMPLNFAMCIADINFLNRG